MDRPQQVGTSNHVLPAPVTTEQEYLAAILDQLRTLNATLAQRPESIPGTIELREPEKEPRRRR